MTTKTRNDAWTPEEDVLLAETVLRCVKEGSTQLKAFEEVSSQVGRSSAAVGFRWNSEVRKQYKTQLAEAKQIAKELKQSIQTPEEPTNIAEETPVSQTVIESVEEVISEVVEEKTTVPEVETEEAHEITNLEFPKELKKIVLFLQQVEKARFDGGAALTKEVKQLQKTLASVTKERDSLAKENEMLKKENAELKHEQEAIASLLSRGKQKK